MIRLKEIIVVLIVSVSLFFSNFAYAKKHRLLMDMAEIGVERYVMKHEMKKLGLKAENRILMKSGERISLDELKTRLLAQRNALAQLSEKERDKLFGYNKWTPKRIAKTHVTWEPNNIRGEGRLFPTKSHPQYDAIMKQYPNGIRYVNKHPDFYNGKNGIMSLEPKSTGDNMVDIKTAYKRMASIIGKTTSEGEDIILKIFRKENVTLHHSADSSHFISVDSDIHSAIRHEGGASYIRKGN